MENQNNLLEFLSITFLWLMFMLLCGITIVHFPAFFGLATFWFGWWFRGVSEKYKGLQEK
jgi:hypothetical protein